MWSVAAVRAVSPLPAPSLRGGGGRHGGGAARGGGGGSRAATVSVRSTLWDFVGGDLVKPDLGQWLDDVEEHKALAIYPPHEGGYEGRYLNQLRYKGYYFLDLSARGLGDPETTLTKIHPVCPVRRRPYRRLAAGRPPFLGGFYICACSSELTRPGCVVLAAEPREAAGGEVVLPAGGGLQAQPAAPGRQRPRRLDHGSQGDAVVTIAGCSVLCWIFFWHLHIVKFVIFICSVWFFCRFCPRLSCSSWPCSRISAQRSGSSQNAATGMRFSIPIPIVAGASVIRGNVDAFLINSRAC